MRLLITGAGGFVGSNLVAGLPADWDVTLLSRQGSSVGTRVVFPPGSDDPLPDALTAEFDVTIHLAGNSDHGLARSAPWEDLVATGVFAAAILARVTTKRIVLLSSAAVYYGLTGRVDPSACVHPEMEYALSKVYVEGLVRTLVASGRCESSLILRLYNAFGPGERPTRLVPSVARAIRDRVPFRLTGDPDSFSDPIHVTEVVRALISGALSEARGTFDLCGGEPVPLREQVRRIGSALGEEPPEIIALPRSAELPIRFYSDPAPLFGALGLARAGSFVDAVRSYSQEVGLLAADNHHPAVANGS